MPGAARSTKEQILLAAERMIADHGVDGVSMRQIATAIGSGNNSAVLYHFGSKEKLVEAIFEHRLPRLRERRAELIAERVPSDLRGWLECQIVAVLEQSDLADSNYLSFVASISQHGERRSSTCRSGSLQANASTRSTCGLASSTSRSHCARAGSPSSWR